MDLGSDRFALLRRQPLERCGPGESLGISGKDGRLAPLPVRVRRPRASTQQVQMHAPMLIGPLPPSRLRLIVERPVPRFPVVDAPAFQLGQHIEHRAAARRHQVSPLRQLLRAKLTSFPHRPGRKDNQVPAIGPIEEDGGAVR